MTLSKPILKYQPNKIICYVLLENNIVGMGAQRVHSYSIIKKNMSTNSYTSIVSGIKNREAIDLIWHDITTNKQK